MESSNRRDFLKAMSAIPVAASVLGQLGAAGNPPNIVYILADDLGYGDVSCLNSDSKLKTTHIDALARTGRIFTDAHAGTALCSPTRYGILTGRYAWRSRLKSGVLWGYSRPLIPTTRLTVPALLKRNGYTTGCVGKWHLGLEWTLTDAVIPKDTPAEPGRNVDLASPIRQGPRNLGFDYFFGIPASLDMPPYVYVENDRVTALPNRETENPDRQEFWRKGPTGADFRHDEVLSKLTDKAISFIDKNAKGPFFLYFPLSAPHTPILPTGEYKGRSKTNIYGDFVLQVDAVVGRVTAALKRTGIENDTIVVVTSDNGCSPNADFETLKEYGHNPSYVFRGYKADIFEGGHRIPFVASWPGHIPAGSASAETICLTDLMDTCAELTGQRLPANAGEDSVSILPALRGEKGTKPIREAVVHHSADGSLSIRQGKWKLAMCPGSGGWSFPRPGQDDVSGLPPTQLYDLEADIAETRNLVKDQPEIAAGLKKLLIQYIRNGRSTPGPVQKNEDEGNWPQISWIDEADQPGALESH
jgi:arylsulfatase A